ncbi:hypothetical protein NLI96_g3261 [Meripilus lineatus]|uniref:Uncharacterized protein n=1 Tax=Meripilus lineatus TaxID=2056292 RepID=A0AAD5YJ85_9APHY|nr:hypothetical protein NLI96_g3261 [Physisporinus lineatus]
MQHPAGPHAQDPWIMKLEAVKKQLERTVRPISTARTMASKPRHRTERKSQHPGNSRRRHLPRRVEIPHSLDRIDDDLSTVRTTTAQFSLRDVE